MPLRRFEGLRQERVEASPRYVDGSFRNSSGVGGPRPQDGTATPVLREFLFGGNDRTPSAPLASVDPRPLWARPVETGLRTTWLGHSTVLIEIGGARILTDPVWAPRASPSRFIGPKRFQPVPVAIDAIGPIDLVIVSHDHYDHLDARSVQALARQGLRFCTSLGVGAHLEAFGVPPQQITELDWWESIRIVAADGKTEVEVSAAPRAAIGLEARRQVRLGPVLTRSEAEAVSGILRAPSRQRQDRPQMCLAS